MGVPSPRTPVRVARGTKSVLETNKAALEEGEVCYATDENTLYVKEGSNIEKTSGTLLDEDNMASNSATQAPTQQSVKAYVDTADATKLALAGGVLTGDVTFDNSGTAHADLVWDSSAGELQFRNSSANGAVSASCSFRSSADNSTFTARGSIWGDQPGNFHVSAPQIIWLSAVDSVTIHNASKTSASFDVDDAAKLYFNNNLKFETTNTGVSATGNIVGSANVSVPDWTGSANAYLAGAGNDLKLYHDGTNSYVVNTTGELRLDPKSGERGIVLTGDAAVDLYYDNVKKLETTAAGVKVTGDSVGNMTTITYNANVALALTSSAYHKVILTGNIAFTCTTEAEGQSGSIFITQDGTGGRTASWSTDFKWPGGTAPTLSTAANAVDRIDYVVLAANTIHCVATLDIK